MVDFNDLSLTGLTDPVKGIIVTTMKLGILGGTFNPIHLGHLIIAQTALEKFQLKRVVFIPNGQPHYKKAKGLAPARHRLKMVKLAMADNSFFSVSDIESQRKGPSYSIETLQKLKSLYPATTKFYFIIGADTLSELPLWRDIKKLTQLCHFITIGRPDTVSLNTKRLTRYLDRSVVADFRRYYLARPLIDISSSEIRNRIRKGQSVKYLVPEEIAKYLRRYKLYQ